MKGSCNDAVKATCLWGIIELKEKRVCSCLSQVLREAAEVGIVLPKSFHSTPDGPP